MDSPGLISYGRSWGYLPQQSPLRDFIFRCVGHPHPYGRLRAKSTIPLIDSKLKTLDLGCGEGVFTRELHQRGVAVTGLDIDENAIHSAKQNMALLKIDYPTVCANAEAIPFADESFDQVVSTDVLEHVNNPETALAEIVRVLRPQGRLIVTVPTPLYLSQPIIPVDFSEQLREIGHLHAGWYAEEARELLASKGLKVMDLRYFGYFPIRLALEVLYAIAGEKGIRATRKKLYNVGLSAFLVYIALIPFLMLERLFPTKRRGAFLVILAQKR